MDEGSVVETADWHTGGEPFRIVTGGVPAIPGATVRERREFARRDAGIDGLRQLLCHEPRGHADMYGGFLVPPDDAGADLGVLFWHKDGFSTACGHGTIALAAWAVATGRVEVPADGEGDVVVDVPSGRVTARVRREGGRITAVTFRNVPSWVVARDIAVSTSRGHVLVDVSWGGALYASARAADVGLSVAPEDLDELIRVGREVKAALAGSDLARHPEDDRLSGIYGTIWFDDLGEAAEGPHQRNVTIFADGQVDRSPCGSGTSARLALLDDEDRLPAGARLVHDSIVGSRFLGAVVERTTEAGRTAVVTEVEGQAFPTGDHRFHLPGDDPLGTGFVLR